MTEVIESRLKLHQDRANHIDYLMSNYGDSNWPGGDQKFKNLLNRLVQYTAMTMLFHC